MKKTEKILDSIWSVILFDTLMAVIFFSRGMAAAGVIFTVGTVMICVLAGIANRVVRVKKDHGQW